MFENIMKFFKKANRKEALNSSSKDTAKERLHLVLMQDRANVSADFLDLMRQEIIEVIKKYIDIDESAMDVRLTNQANEDGTQGAPALYANIPIVNIKDETRKLKKEKSENNQKEEVKEELKETQVQKEDDEETKKIQEEAMKIVEEEQKVEKANKQKVNEEKDKNIHSKKDESGNNENDAKKEKIDKKESKDE